MVAPMVFQASFNLVADLRPLRMPNNTEMKFHKNHIYESLTDTLFLSQVPLCLNVFFIYLLLASYSLATYIQVNTA